MDRPPPQTGLAGALGNVGSARSMAFSPSYPNLALEDMMALANTNTARFQQAHESPYKTLLSSSKMWIALGILGFLALLYVIYSKYGPKMTPNMTNPGTTTSNPPSCSKPPLSTPASGQEASEQQQQLHPSAYGIDTVYNPLNSGYNLQLQQELRKQQQQQARQSQQSPDTQLSSSSSSPTGGRLASPSLNLPPSSLPTVPQTAYDPEYFYREGMKDRDAKIDQTRLNTLEMKVGNLLDKMSACMRRIRSLERHGLDDESFLKTDKEKSDRKSETFPKKKQQDSLLEIATMDTNVSPPFPSSRRRMKKPISNE